MLGSIFPPVFAAEKGKGPSTKGGVAVVDFQKVIAVSRRGQQAREKLKSEVFKRQREIEGYQQELERLENDYEEKHLSLSGSDWDDYEARFRARVKELRRRGEDVQALLAKRERELTAQLVDELKELTGRYAEEKGYSAVFELNAFPAAYADPKADITAAIIDRYDAEAVKSVP
ncbi:MAG: OmpH family outer membrane protein [Bdellovibrionota bacterium]